MRLLYIVLLALFIGPIILSVGGYTVTGLYLLKTTRDIQAMSANTEPAVYVSKLDVTNHLDSRDRVKNGYLSIIKPQKLGKLRSIALDSDIDVSTLLKPGESVPGEAFLEVFVDARATSYAERECEALNEYLTTQCALISVSARVSKDGKTVSLRANYDYVQRPDFGSFDPKQSLRYHEIHQDIDQPVNSSPREARGRIYQHVATLCENLRQAEGNCGLTRLRVQHGRAGASSFVGRASFGVMQPRA